MKIVAALIAMLLPVLAGLNYVRNEPLDRDLEDRTYAGISDEDLAALLDAYKVEVDRMKSALDQEPVSDRLSDPSKRGSYDEKVQAFESFQRSNSDWRRNRAATFEREAEVKALLHEKRIRDRGLHLEHNRILRRVLTL